MHRFFLNKRCPKCGKQNLILEIDWDNPYSDPRIYCDTIYCDYESIREPRDKERKSREEVILNTISVFTNTDKNVLLSDKNRELIKNVINNVCNSDYAWNGLEDVILKELLFESSSDSLDELVKELNLRNNNIISKEQDGLEIIIYKDLLDKAISLDYESLMFNSGEVFVEVNGEDDSVILKTNGHVSIFDTEENIKYSDSERFNNEEIMKLISSGDIYNSKRYEVNESNWFSSVYLKKDPNGNLRSVDDLLLDDIPKDINSLVDYMLDLYNYWNS